MFRFLLLLIWIPLAADWQTGAAYYEAGEYPKAIALFEELLTHRLTASQEAIVRYDLATAKLAGGDALGALADYEKIDPPEHMVQSVAVGRARAHSLRAEQLLEAEQFLPCQAELLEALAIVDELEEERELQAVLKRQAATLLTSWQEHYWSHLTKAEAAAELSASAAKTMGHLEALGQGAGETRLVRQLGQAQRRLRPLWEILEEHTDAASLHQCASERMEEGQIWGARRDLAEMTFLVEQIRTGGDPLAMALKGREARCTRLGVTGSGPLREAVAAERDIWSRGGRALCAERRAQSEDAVEQQMLRTLEERLRTPDPDRQNALADSWFYTLIDTPSVDGIIDLHQEVKRGAASETWQPRLEALQVKTRAEGSERAAELLASDGDLISNLEQALRALELRAWLRLKFTDWKERADFSTLCTEGEDCLQALSEAGEQHLMEVVWNTLEGWRIAALEKASCSRLCHEEALHWIARGERLIGPGVNSAAELLQIGIGEQEHAKVSLSRFDDLGLLQSLRPEITELMQRKEQAILEETEGFVGLLFAESGDLQQEPYAKVLQLFDEGVEEGKGVFPHLSSDFENWRGASGAAERSEQKWREALNELNPPEDDQDDDQEEEEEEEESGGAPQEAMELLQEMDRQDEMQTGPQRPPKQGLRPW